MLLLLSSIFAFSIAMTKWCAVGCAVCSDTVHRKEEGGGYTFLNVSGFSPRDRGLAMVSPNESLAFYTDVLSYCLQLMKT